jgi:hypothetical protein
MKKRLRQFFVASYSILTNRKTQAAASYSILTNRKTQAAFFARLLSVIYKMSHFMLGVFHLAYRLTINFIAKAFNHLLIM